jgi:hypothetical protein
MSTFQGRIHHGISYDSLSKNVEVESTMKHNVCVFIYIYIYIYKHTHCSEQITVTEIYTQANLDLRP